VIVIYLMSPPEQFTVEYQINPWMKLDEPVDRDLALKQWESLRTTLLDLGHQVHILPAVGGLPDMVYAANGAFSVDGVVYGARFKYAQRAAESDAHRAFYEADPAWKFVAPTQINEGEGDFAYLRGRELIIAGYGFRTEPAAHAEAQEALGRPVLSLRLVDDRFYHLDTALAVLDEDRIVYYPGAFSASSRRVLAQLFPDAMLADEADALVFGLNLVSDGRNVLLPAEATGLASRLAAADYRPVPIELGELKRGGGSVKCCIAELRP
jgi:N-dimethylarginine dimethylaminohydrolase